METPEAEKFWSNVDRTGECWLWLKSTRSYGYGQYWFRRKIVETHRISWILTHGDIPKGMCVCHACDVPACVNPSHLFLGTQRDNLADMHRKGRDFSHFREHPSKGEANRRAKLTEDEVRAIRTRYASGESLRALGRAFHVDFTCISSVVNRKTWRHIT